MEKISRILVADDLVREDKDEPSPSTNLAISLAEPLGAEVRLVHVYDLPKIPVPPESLNLIELPYVQAMSEALEAEADALRESRPNLQIVSTVAKGPIVEVLLQQLQEQNCQLAILGAQSTGVSRGGKLGQIAEAMLRHSPVPVLTVAPQAQVERDYSVTNILIPVDFSPTTTPLVDVAIGSFAQPFGASVTLVHVLEEWAYPVVQSASLLAGGVVFPLERDLQELANQRHAQLTELADSIRKDYPGLVNVHIRLVERAESVAAGIHEIAELTHADLIAIGHRHRTRLQDTVLGSTSRVIAREARFPVLSITPAFSERFQAASRKSA